MPRKTPIKRKQQTLTKKQISSKVKRKRSLKKKKSSALKKPKSYTMSQFIDNMDKILKHQDQRYFLRISPITSLEDRIQYHVSKTHLFENMKQNFEPFKDHFKTTETFKFDNLKKDAILVVPKPHSGKNYLTLYDFLKNASPSQLKYFKKVTLSGINEGLKRWGQVFVNTHGLGVPYFHLRIDRTGKYY